MGVVTFAGTGPSVLMSTSLMGSPISSSCSSSSIGSSPEWLEAKGLRLGFSFGL